MSTIEFRTTVKNGVIEIPRKFRKLVKNQVRVILVPESKKTKKNTLIDQLLEKPVTIKGFRPLGRDELYER
jgi:hypothetical protein